MAWILSYVAFIACLIMGAICISDAITAFKNKKNFLFGLNILFTLACVFLMAKYIFVIW